MIFTQIVDLRHSLNNNNKTKKPRTIKIQHLDFPWHLVIDDLGPGSKDDAQPIHKNRDHLFTPCSLQVGQQWALFRSWVHRWQTAKSVVGWQLWDAFNLQTIGEWKFWYQDNNCRYSCNPGITLPNSVTGLEVFKSYPRQLLLTPSPHLYHVASCPHSFWACCGS